MDLILEDPNLGTEKKSDLSNLFVFKFKIGKEHWILGYTFNNTKKIVTWNAIGQHENFYRELKQ